MQISDYRCTNKKCNNIFEYTKYHALEDFPKQVKCPECSSNSDRVYGMGKPVVSEGRLGNAKNGYSSRLAKYYQYSHFGRIKGTRIK